MTAEGCTTERMRRAVLASLFLVVFVLSLRPIESYDFWFHLATGRLISQTHALPRADPFSPNSSGEWLPHAWLSELLLWQLCRPGAGDRALRALLLLKAVIVATAFTIVAGVSLRQRAGWLVVLAATLLAFWASLPMLDARPHALTILLFAGLIGLVERFDPQTDRCRTTLFLVAVPALMALWANLHGGFIMGLGLLAGFACGSGVEALEADPPLQAQARSRASLFAVGFLLSLGAVSFSPRGLGALWYAFSHYFGSVRYATSLIREWQPPDYTTTFQKCFGLTVLLLALALATSRKRPSWSWLLLTTALLGASLASRRNIGFFATAWVPFVSQLSAGRQLRALRWATGRSGVLLGPATLGLLTLGLLLGGARSARDAWREPIRRDLLPVDGVSFIRLNSLPGPLFNPYEWGGYAMFVLAPRYGVFVDGRADLYSGAFLRQYETVARGAAGWQEALADHETNTVLTERDCTLSQLLLLSAGWHRIYRDHVCEVFLRRSNENTGWLQSYAADRLRYPHSADALFYRGLDCAERGLLARAEQHWRSVVALRPTDPEAWANLGSLLAGRGDYRAAVECWLSAARSQHRVTPETCRNLAEAYTRLGASAEAERWRRRAQAPSGQ